MQLKAGNGYTHLLRVPCDGSTNPATNALPLLQRLFPFTVSTGGKRKKAVKNGVPVHEYWLEAIYNTVVEDFPYIPRCRNHNWLDWTDGNIYVEWNEAQRQRVFEEQTSFHGSLLNNDTRDVLLSRFGKAAAVHTSTNPDIAGIFAQAQKWSTFPIEVEGHC